MFGFGRFDGILGEVRGDIEAARTRDPAARDVGQFEILAMAKATPDTKNPLECLSVIHESQLTARRILIRAIFQPRRV